MRNVLMTDGNITGGGALATPGIGQPGPPPLAAFDSACVVIVDDQPANVALLQRLVRSAGIEHVHALTDPREAVRRCLGTHADLLILDLHMPVMDGFAVMAELQAALPADAFLPVLVLTADSTTDARDRALKAGAKDFLTKPFDSTEVLLRVRNLLETRALYASVQRHNAALQADLERRLREEQQRAEQRRLRLQRVTATLADRAFSMVFQPIAHLHSGEIVGVEALARFEAEPLRPPNEWFEEAAMVGRGLDLELAAAEAALVELDRLPDGTFISVNISPATATAPETLELIDRHPADRIVLELTEHVRITDYEALLQALDALRARGVRIAVDDAGAGYSGLKHVLRLSPDVLKLDTALTRGIHADPARRALSRAMVSFAEEMNATIVAEGVESAEELESLRDLKVPCVQGFHIARPGELPLQQRLLERVAHD